MKETKKIILAGMFLAIGAMISIFFHSFVPGIGLIISPLHIPVLICGLFLGYKYGTVVGILTPLLSSFMFDMPILVPMAILMMFECGMYGFISGVFNEKFILYKKNKIVNIYITLIIAMIIGRIVFGIASASFTWIIADFESWKGFKEFVETVFIGGIPGMILHILVIPAIMYALYHRSGKLDTEENRDLV